jgi:hypothetical protein
MTKREDVMKAVAALFFLLAGPAWAPLSVHAEEKSAPPLSRERESGFRALDIRVAGVEALVARIDDPAYKASMVAVVEDFKKRREDLKKNFDQIQFDALMHNVNRNYQIVSLWLKSPRTPAQSGEKKS